MGTLDIVADLATALGANEASMARVAARTCPPERRDDLLFLLAIRAGAGSPLATELLIEELDESGVVRRFVHSALLDESAIDDVCQDSLISIASSVSGFNGQSKVTTWVNSIVRRRVIDHLRRQRATAPLTEVTHSPSQRMSSMLTTRSAVRNALTDLPDPYRLPVTLRDLEGLSYAQVAQRLNLPLGTVKGQISRGRALLAALLSEEDWQHP